MSATDSRRNFGSAPCDNPTYNGPAHPGHARCIRARRRLEAEVRQEDVAPEKTKRYRKGVAAANAARRARGRMVQGMPRQTPVQRERAARQRIRSKKRSQRPALDLPEDEQRGG